MSEIRDRVVAACQEARQAAIVLRQLSRADKDRAIEAIADALVAAKSDVLAANAIDVARAESEGVTASMVDRLRLTEQRLTEIASAARAVAGLADPVGEVVREYTLANGVELTQVRVPLGVVAMIYEARPNVTVDAAVLCLKSGNSAMLRGSASALSTNLALVAVMRQALASCGLPEAAITLAPGDTRETVDVLLRARGLVDVVIPRGGASLIANVVDNATVPVIETGVGNCHLYVAVAADLSKAVAITLNSKAQRVSVCNSLETLLVDAQIADEFLPLVMKALAEAGVAVHGDEVCVAAAKAAGAVAVAATDDDWAGEYLSLDLACRVVPDLAAAVSHIQRWSTGHTEAIVTEDPAAAEQFVAAVDSAAVMVNASTRFTDGGEFGFGAEIGISTQKLHARGPMGLTELTSTKYILRGQGQIRA